MSITIMTDNGAEKRFTGFDKPYLSPAGTSDLNVGYSADDVVSLIKENNFLKNITTTSEPTLTLEFKYSDINKDHVHQFCDEHDLVMKASPYNDRAYLLFLKDYIDNPQYFSIHLTTNYMNVMTMRVHGSHELVKQYESYVLKYQVAGKFNKPKASINWVINKDSAIAGSVEYQKEVGSAYPWLDMSIKEYSDAFFESRSNILLLMGPPGCGKSSFIKQMAYQSEKDMTITYNQDMIRTGQIYSHFFESDSNLLIVEDADTLLGKREDGNELMSAILNIGDGVVSTIDKKIVFSTNLTSLSHIDPALLRPGRCFDILNFRKLTFEEALAVLDETARDKDLVEGKEYTLAELINEDAQYFSSRTKIRKNASSIPTFGFGLASR